MEIIKNNDYNVTITGVTSEGSGVAKIDGYAVFVPNTAVGDECIIKIIKVNKSYGYGKLIKILKPSSSRIEIDCDKFNQCGGCTYRHISYDEELNIKYNHVADCFKKIGGFDLKPNKIIGSAKQYEYRNKAQFPVGYDNDNIVSGFFAKRSHRIINCDNCKLQPKLFSDIKNTIIEFMEQNKIKAYDENTNTGLIRHIYIRKGEHTNETMVCLVSTSKKIPLLEDLISLLTSKYNFIKSIVLNINKDKTNVILGEKCYTVFGEDFITDSMCDVNFNISPLSFYQVNTPQAELLYKKAIEYANLNKEDILLDLYCGIGTIGLTAANKVKKLVGVEVIDQAVENAKQNAKLNNFNNTMFLCSDAGKAAKTLAQEGLLPSVIIVDPPRKGIDENVVDAIVKMSPQKVVMISCNPSTAARDAKMLVENGYVLNEITPFDLFPRTTHVECVVLMSK